MGKTKTTEEFISAARKVHGDQYDYSRVNYIDAHSKVYIICPKHGEFWQTPNNHLNGAGCNKCGIEHRTNARRSSQEAFINAARLVHGNKYDYSHVEYISAHQKVCIICPEHGPFWQKPNSHLNGSGCAECGKQQSGLAKKKTSALFIEQAKKIHGDKYDYSKVVYKVSHEKVCIICPKHGDFWQTPSDHLRGSGCPACGIEHRSEQKRFSQEDFISAARTVHGNKYDYSKVNYVSSEEKVCIVCPVHGEFWQSAGSHLQGIGCKLCASDSSARKRRKSFDEFVQAANTIHSGKYDYSKVDYVSANSKVCIICPEHGEFWQTPASHLNGNGCRFCAGVAPYTTESFIAKAKEIHGNLYDYSKVSYINSDTKVCIVCPIHGEFWQDPGSHLRGAGCRACVGTAPYSTESFIEKANLIHLGKYDYSKTDYQANHLKVCIICPKHGEFWQTPHSHLSGQGCPSCQNSLLEDRIRIWLTENKIEFIEQKTFPWLADKKKLRIDFYLPKYMVAIECQGYQHFGPIDAFGGHDAWQATIRRDALKQELCQRNGIRVLYYSNLGIDYPYLVYEDKDELLNAIMQH